MSSLKKTLELIEMKEEKALLESLHNKKDFSSEKNQDNDTNESHEEIGLEKNENENEKEKSISLKPRA